MSQPSTKLLKEMQEASSFNKQKNEKLEHIIDYLLKENYFDRKTKKEEILADLNMPITLDRFCGDNNYKYRRSKTLLMLVVEDMVTAPKEHKLAWIKFLLECGAKLFVSVARNAYRWRDAVGRSDNDIEVHVVIDNYCVFNELFYYKNLACMPGIRNCDALEILSEHMSVEINRETNSLCELVSQPHSELSRLPNSISALIAEYVSVIDNFYDPYYVDLQNIPFDFEYDQIAKRFRPDIPHNMHPLFSFFAKQASARRKSETDTLQTCSDSGLTYDQDIYESKESADSIYLKDLQDVFSTYKKLLRLQTEESGSFHSEMYYDTKKYYSPETLTLSQPINPNKESLLHFFATRGHTDMVKRLMEIGVNRNHTFLKRTGVSKDTWFDVEQSILLETMLNGQLDTVEYLLKCGKSDLDLPGIALDQRCLELRHIYGFKLDIALPTLAMTPLMWAIINRNEYVNGSKNPMMFPSCYFVKMLLAAGADLKKTTCKIIPIEGYCFKQEYERVTLSQKEAKEKLEAMQIPPKETALDLSLRMQTQTLRTRNSKEIKQEHEIRNLIYYHIYVRIQKETGRRPESRDYKPYSCIERSHEFWNELRSTAEKMLLGKNSK